jgi:uncharacterized phiE125 gp8 family phage protein
MPAILLTPPAAEPIALADAKNFLRVEHDADDALIAALIAAARGAVERSTRRLLITQTWRIVLDRWPKLERDRPCSLNSPVNPLQSITAARIFAEDGSAEAIDTAVFALDKASAPARIDCSPFNIPSPGRALAGIELDVVAGYGAAADVPAPLAQAVRVLVAQSYEHRDRIDSGTLPDAVARLLAPFRVFLL